MDVASATTLDALRRRIKELERENEALADQADCAAAAELAQAEQRFRAIVEASPTPLLLSRLHDGTILYANDRLEALVGAEPGSLVGRQTPDFYYDPADRPEVLRTVQQQGYIRDFELRIRRADGTPRWVSLTVQHLAFDGEPALATSLLDITERKAAEDALREQTLELEAIFRALPDLYFRMEADGTILAYRSGRTLGLYTPPEAFLGQRVQDVLPPPVGPMIGEALAEVARTGDLVHLEYMLPLGTERRDFEARLLPLDGDQVIAVVRDVTARTMAEDSLRASEASYRGLFDALTELVYIQDLEGRFIAVNEAVVRAYGYSRDAIVGQTPDFLGVPETIDPEAFAEVFARAVGGEPQRFEWWGRRKDGSTFPKEVVIKRSTYFGQDVIIAVARNITEQKEAEQALRESEALKRGIVAAALDSIITVDGDGRVVEFNPAAERTFGYCADEVLGQPMVNFIVPHRLRDAHEAGMNRYRRTGEAHVLGQRIEVPALRADGSEFPAELAIDAVRLENGREVFTAYLRDITERKEAEQALRRSEEYFRRLTENGLDLIQLIDADGKTTYVSPSVERLTGYKPEEMVGRPAERGVHRDDLEHTLDALALAGARPGTTQTAEYRIRHKDGSWRVFEAYGRTFSPTSADEGVVVNARDITDRKEAERALQEREAHFRRLIENAYDMVLVMDAAGTITYASPSSQRVLGSAPEELTGRSGFSLVHPDDVDTALARTTETVATPGVVVSAELRLRHRDGSYRILETFCRTVADDSAASGIVVNARDATERVETERALQFQKTLLEAEGEASIDGILVVSPEGQILSYNARFVEMWGIPTDVAAARSDEAALQAVIDRVADPEAFLARVEHLYAHPDEKARDEIRLRDGRVFDRYSAPVRSQEGDYYGRIWFFRDITERKTAEEALRVSHEREREHAHRLEEELEVGRRIQLSFLPAELTRPTGWEIDVRFQPALQVAGDFYDTFGLPIGRVGLLVADVCGKGVGAALYMALFRSLLRAHAERASALRLGTPHAAEAVLKEAVTATNQYIARVHRPTHLRKLGHTFASVFFGLLDPQSGTLHYVNAGHEPPVLIGPKGPAQRLTPTGPALGLIADAALEVETVTIAPGETLLVYTDGVTEARDAEGGFFDEEGLLPLLRTPASSAAGLLDRIEQAIHDFADGATAADDVTLMAVRRKPR